MPPVTVVNIGAAFRREHYRLIRPGERGLGLVAWSSTDYQIRLVNNRGASFSTA